MTFVCVDSEIEIQALTYASPATLLMTKLPFKPSLFNIFLLLFHQL